MLLDNALTGAVFLGLESPAVKPHKAFFVVSFLD